MLNLLVCFWSFVTLSVCSFLLSTNAPPPPYTLDLQPAAIPSLQAYHNVTLSSWGGNALKAKDGKYHGYFAAMRNPPGSKGICNLGAWTSNSEVIHAVSDSAAGPFKMKDVALPPWHHNPQIMLHPDGTFLLFTIGQTLSNTKQLAAGGAVFRTELHHASNIVGPWQSLGCIINGSRFGSKFCPN